VSSIYKLGWYLIAYGTSKLEKNLRKGAENKKKVEKHCCIEK